jgi:hypothetical protein
VTVKSLLKRRKRMKMKKLYNKNRVKAFCNKCKYRRTFWDIQPCKSCKIKKPNNFVKEEKLDD